MMVTRPAGPPLVTGVELLGERLQELPGDARVRLDEGAELPWREAVAAELRLGRDGRGPGPFGDQGDLAEVVAGTEPSDFVAADLDLRLALADHEETDAALALLGHGLAGVEGALVHGAGDRLELARIEAAEERDVLKELGRFRQGRVIVLRGLRLFDPLRELLDLPLRRVEPLAAEVVQLLAALPERDRLVERRLPVLEALHDQLQLLLRVLERQRVSSTRAPKPPSSSASVRRSSTRLGSSASCRRAPRLRAVTRSCARRMRSSARQRSSTRARTSTSSSPRAASARGWKTRVDVRGRAEGAGADRAAPRARAGAARRGGRALGARRGAVPLLPRAARLGAGEDRGAREAGRRGEARVVRSRGLGGSDPAPPERPALQRPRSARARDDRPHRARAHLQRRRDRGRGGPGRRRFLRDPRGPGEGRGRRQRSPTARSRRLLRRDRPDLRRAPDRDRHGRVGAPLLRPHAMGVPPPRPDEREHRLEAPAGARQAARLPSLKVARPVGSPSWVMRPARPLPTLSPERSRAWLKATVMRPGSPIRSTRASRAILDWTWVSGPHSRTTWTRSSSRSSSSTSTIRSERAG